MSVFVFAGTCTIGPDLPPRDTVEHFETDKLDTFDLTGLQYEDFGGLVEGDCDVQIVSNNTQSDMTCLQVSYMFSVRFS